MQVEPLAIPDVLLITPGRHADDRGVFSEVFRADVLAAHGAEPRFVQENQVVSHRRGVLRGLHFQAPPRAQGKLVRCARGAVWDVAVDIRAGSPSLGRHVAVELSAASGAQMWIPAGFAHGYLTLEDGCEVVYKTTDYYDLASEQGIAWDDPALAIDWRLEGAAPILSEKDRRQPRFGHHPSVFTYRA
jgi:dTDP-4-dehydrorhamnose 3,5-epimerase